MTYIDDLELAFKVISRILESLSDNDLESKEVKDLHNYLQRRKSRTEAKIKCFHVKPKRVLSTL